MESFGEFPHNGSSSLGGGLLQSGVNDLLIGSLLDNASLEGSTGLSTFLKTLKSGVGKDALTSELEHRLTLDSAVGDGRNSTSTSTASNVFDRDLDNSIVPSLRQGFPPILSGSLSSPSASSDSSTTRDSLTGIAEASPLIGAETLRVEAEDASKVTLATYRRETKSGVPLISLVGGTSNETGTATHTFNGPAGSYNIIVGYYDENDGTASMLARIEGTQVDSWVLNQNLGSAGVSPQNLVRRTIATGRTLNPGTVIQLQGTENADEAARIDFLEFVPTSTGTLRVEAEDASKVTLATYRPETKSGVPLISLVGGTSNETGTATHTFNGPAGSYNIIVGYYDENDGTASMLARIEGTQVDSWVLNQNLGSAGVSPQNLVRRTIATGRTLNPGTVIQLQGTENADEAARIDFLEFVPAGSPPPPPPPADTIRINAGGPPQNVSGVTWSDSTGFVSGGFAYAENPPPTISNVVSPANQAIYQTEWTGGATNGVPVGGTAFTYNVPVSNGTYNVRLHFAELNKFASGQRIFDVNLEGGAKELTNFDIFAEAGGAHKAIVRDFTTAVADGNVTIDFIRQVENAKISGIEIYPGSNPPPPPPPPPPTSLFTWGNAAPSPIPRFEAQGIAANGKLYVFGGFINGSLQTTVRSDVYDPATNQWTQIANMPEPLTHSPVVVDGQSIYVLGGYVGNHPGGSTDHVWKYSIPTNTWSAAPSLPVTRGAGAAVRLGRELHFFGGATRTAGQLDEIDQEEHFVLSLDGGTSWSSSLAPLPNPRNHLAGVAFDGKAYIIGGQHGRDEDQGNQSQVDIYNPSTNTWTSAADLPAPRGHISSSAFFTKDNRIFAIGGTLNGNKPAADVTAYDLQTNVWLKFPSLPAARKTPVADVFGDQIVVTTGNGGGATTTTWTGVFANKWESSTTAPVPLGEVAGGIIGNQLYLVGEGNSATLAHNLSTGTWSGTSALATRPFVGDHHAAEVFNGKLYLFGGLDGGADGKVQIYNPTTNAWSLGANMPFAAGSSASAVIGGEVYVAGGIIGSSTTTQTAKYNPATNTWTLLAPMKQGSNHAAAATDGTKLYVFGGRDGGNVPSNGFDTVQVYNPATNTWASSSDAGSTLAPLPEARGGTGKAIYFNNEFYVMGGETQNDPDANAQGVYNRVDIYNPLTNTWRLGASMPTARHGIFPVLLAGRIHVPGGGTQAGFSSSSLFEIYNPA